MNYLNNFLFSIYPYIGLAIFFLGSLIRYDREQYTWRSYSSQILQRRMLAWGSNLFHVGILFLFFGHLFGLLVPHWIYESLGLSVPAKQMLAIVSGGIAGLICLAGLTLLLYRRLSEPKISANTTTMDLIILFLILFILLLGLSTLFVSVHHTEGGIMLQWGDWAQRIWTLRPGAAGLVENVPTIYKIHVVAGMTLFLLLPFGRLVHVWSGFGSLAYLGRSYQVVRRRSKQSVRL